MERGNKKTRSRMFQVFIILLLALLAVAAVALPGLYELLPKAKPMEVSILIRESDSSLWANTRLGMEYAAHDMGADLRFVASLQNDDPKEQYEQFLHEIDRGCDAVVITPVSPEWFDEQLKQSPASIPIIAMESPLNAAHMAVLADNSAIGIALAETLIQDRPLSDSVLLLTTSRESSSVSERLYAARNILEREGVLVDIIEVDLDLIGASLDQLIAESNATAIITFESAATQYAADMIERMNLDMGVYGIGGTNSIAAALERGVISAIAIWNDYAAGYFAVQVAVRAARKEEMQPYHQLDFSIVRGENMYEPENQKLLFPVTH